MVKRFRAFSLIEVLIVLAIIGLIVSLVVPVMQQERNKAAYDVSMVQLHQVCKAMERHYLETGRYPVFKTWKDLVASDSPLAEYISSLPEKDGFDREYEIEESTETDFKFLGYGPPGKMKEKLKDYYGMPGPKIEVKK